jgi:hypothetical protein
VRDTAERVTARAGGVCRGERAIGSAIPGAPQRHAQIVAAVLAGGGHEYVPFGGQSVGLIHDVTARAAEIIETRGARGDRHSRRPHRPVTDGHPLAKRDDRR